MNENKNKSKGDAWSRTKKLGSGALGYGFIGIDAYSRIKDGENPVMAVGKAALTNAAWSLVPGGLPVMLATSLLSSAPDIANQLDQAKSTLNNTKHMWGGEFEATEGSQAALQMDTDFANQSRSELARAMAGYARKNNNPY